ncbi:MAG: DMT family transporter [Deltaproteobacteria bacterium]|nr:DMT family transporter [Deltaproteobacteria bacterium]MBT4268684.1 DMT family transporter [Deltaproteobacteria bacterium]MBT4642323.1 DMT family transporter [Deltaproteobacteria bacterium]MBT6503267.1 DMT family transporter [Deltaproteobacteria bacterium]MBT6614095.1 DMT family transporter [Deltaproteobacteria bacterium]
MLMNSKLKGTVFVLICVALWALIPVVAKLGQTTLDNHQFLFWSSLVSFIVLGIAATVAGTIGEIKKYSLLDWLYFLFLGLLGTYIYYLFLYLGYSQAVGIEVLVFQYTWPVLIVVFSIFILKEKLTTRKLTALLFGIAGVVTVLTKGEFQHINVSNPGVIALVATGASCFALFSVLSKTVQKNAYSVVVVYFFAALIASFASMLYFSEFVLPASAEIIPVLLNGVFVNGFSYIFWVVALKSAEASYLAPFTFITPILSAIYLVLFFGEPFILAYGIGLICIVAGGLVNSLGNN